MILEKRFLILGTKGEIANEIDTFEKVSTIFSGDKSVQKLIPATPAQLLTGRLFINYLP